MPAVIRIGPQILLNATSHAVLAAKCVIRGFVWNVNQMDIRKYKIIAFRFVVTGFSSLGNYVIRPFRTRGLIATKNMS